MNQPPAGGPLEGERIGPYRLDAPIGSGGMGTVWRAWDERLRRHVAIKQVLRDSARGRERLRREARSTARLSHPAIVHVYDLLEGDGADWIVMELVSGQNLRQLLDREGRLEVGQALQLGREIAEGLAEAHAHGILHRDLKTANIMVTASGRAKILDFGLAKELRGEGAENAGSDLSLSTPGAVIGTSFAMSPEQALGQDLDVRSDLFSFGSLLYEALSGGAPFRAEDARASLARVLYFRPRPLHEVRSDVPRGLSRLIERLLEKEPRERPASAGEVCESLASLAAQHSLESPGSGKSPGALDESAGSAARATAETFVQGKPAEAPTLGEPQPAQGGRSAGSGSAVGGERRTVTVVCCGLTGNAEGFEETRSLDLEALSEAMLGLQDLAKEIIEPLGGQTGAVVGHLLYLCFGYPHAHEDDPQRAVRAALEILARVAAGSPFLGEDVRLAVRLAVHTGPTVVLARPGQDAQLQLGTTFDDAASLARESPIGRVLVSPATQRLIAKSFATEVVGSSRQLNAGHPVPLYGVVGLSNPWERDNGSFTRFVGRQGELDLLVGRYHLARAGTGQMVAVSGEAGIGKSRLVRALREKLQEEGEPPQWAIGYSSLYTQSSPLFPLIDLLERTIFSGAGGSYQRSLEDLEEFLGRCGAPIAEVLPLFAPLLSLPNSEKYPPLALGPEMQRKKTFEAIIAVLLYWSERRPLVLVFEDLHWVDPSSLALLGLLAEEIATVPLLLVVTLRPEFQAPWSLPSHATRINLSRLMDQEVASLIESVARGRELLFEVRRQIAAKTDGVPLFVEELTKAVLETTPVRGQLEVIPSTLQGSLLARLDRLKDGKTVAQLASIIGRTFSLDLLAEISSLDHESVQRGLDELLQAELIYRRGLGAKAHYIFKHALIQETAYAALLQKDRRNLHLRIARALEEHLSEPDPGQLEVIARHFTAAGRFAEAIDYWTQAGRRSKGAYANDEAVSFYEQALSLLPEVRRPEDGGQSARLHEDLGDIKALLGRRDEARAAFLDALGPISPDESIWRARLNRKIGRCWVDDHDTELALRSFDAAGEALGREDENRDTSWRREWLQIQFEMIWLHYWNAELEMMRERVRRVEPFIDGYATPLQRAAFFTNLYQLNLRQCRYQISESILQVARELVAASEEAGEISQISLARFSLAMGFLLFGAFDEAEQGLQDALELARKIGDASSEARCMTYLGMLSRKRGRIEETRRHSLESAAASAASGMQEYLGTSRANLAWVAWRERDLEGAERWAKEAMSCWKSLAWPMQWTARLPLIAILVEQGRLEEAFQMAPLLCHPSQRRLPGEAEEAINQAVRSWQEGRPDSARAALERGLALAAEGFFL